MCGSVLSGPLVTKWSAITDRSGSRINDRSELYICGDSLVISYQENREGRRIKCPLQSDSCKCVETNLQSPLPRSCTPIKALHVISKASSQAIGTGMIHFENRWS